ncbi:divalent-cation tolerance protein CutA [Candidatus Micrarchaeota archaeon]|nr:divalent-cation tolerance protein CutA [Candidatus Micrarchaeota archaeon]
MQLTLLYVPFPSEKTALQAAACLIHKKLIACANVFQSTSMFRWKGKLQKQKEYVLIAKTTPASAKKAKKEIERLHPYELPCILQTSADANEKYAKWAKAQTI